MTDIVEQVWRKFSKNNGMVQKQLDTLDGKQDVNHQEH